MFTRYLTLPSNPNALAFRKLRFAKILQGTLKTVPRRFVMLWACSTYDIACGKPTLLMQSLRRR